MAEQTVVIGLGEVGRPLCELIAQTGAEVLGVDAAPVDLPAPGTVAVMHICFPFEIDDFVGETARYVDRLRPELTVINSTVGVGTTRAVHERTGGRIVHSPVRGKHARMVEELTYYDKFIGPIDADAGVLAKQHFESLGMTTKVLSSPEASELAKLQRRHTSACCSRGHRRSSDTARPLASTTTRSSPSTSRSVTYRPSSSFRA